MILGTSIVLVILAWKISDWRNWQKYHNTMLFVAVGNLLYNFITAGYYLWRLEGDALTNFTISELLYTFVIFPATVLIFLNNFPITLKGKVIRILTWISFYAAWEYILYQLDLINYQYGWNMFYSIIFNFIMFPTIYIHSKKPLLAYLISAMVVIIVVLAFDIPIHLPIEDR